MTIEQSKEKLKKDGYTWFELNDFDPEFYNWLSPLKYNESNDLKIRTTSVRIDMDNHPEIPNHQIKKTFKTYDEANELMNKTLSDYKDMTRFSQAWYYADLPEFLEPSNLEMRDYKKYIKNVVKYFFDFDESQLYSDLSFCTYYDVGCHLQNHSDGTGTGRICALLIYLNEEYDESNGGCLILNNKENVVPTFGKVALIDLQSFDIKHMVTKVTGGLGRFAILSFVKRIEDEGK